MEALFLTISVCAFAVAFIIWEVQRNLDTCEDITQETGIDCGADCPVCNQPHYEEEQ